MANKKDRYPKAYFDAARGYQSAADRLLLSIESGEKLLIRDPTYFLYAHAVELALEACLLSSGFDPASSGPAGHGIEGLYQECRGHKLLGTNDADREINNLVYFLGAGNGRTNIAIPISLRSRGDCGSAVDKGGRRAAYSGSGASCYGVGCSPSHHPAANNARRFLWASQLSQSKPSRRAPIRIAVTAEAFAAIARTLPVGSVAYEPAVEEGDLRYIWLEPRWLDRLNSYRGPGESYSDVILRLAGEG